MSYIGSFGLKIPGLGLASVISGVLAYLCRRCRPWWRIHRDSLCLLGLVCGVLFTPLSGNAGAPHPASTRPTLFPLSVVGNLSHDRSDSLIPQSDQITSFDARLALARILAYEDRTLDEALREYRVLLNQSPDNWQIRSEMARVLIRLGDINEARSLMAGIDKKAEKDPDMLVTLADLKASMGHASGCRDLYEKAIRMSDQPQNIKLKLADHMNMWGDFYKAEAIYREYLRAHAGDREVALKLAALLRSCERYAESEGIYKELLFNHPDSKKALLGLAKLKRAEKKYQAALTHVDQALNLDPDNHEALLLKADILLLVKNYDAALGLYSRISDMACCRVKGLMGQGNVYLAQGEEDLGRLCFSKAYEIDPSDVEAHFYAAGMDVVLTEDFIDALLTDKGLSARTLEKWANLYAAHGFNNPAILIYETSLKRDPAYFPSQIGLAEMLAIDHQYKPAIEAFEDLNKRFPDNRKILIGWARTLGWGKSMTHPLNFTTISMPWRRPILSRKWKRPGPLYGPSRWILRWMPTGPFSFHQWTKRFPGH